MNESRPTEASFLHRLERSRQLVGMLHVPVTSLLAAPPSWRDRLGHPRLSPKDAELMAAIERESAAGTADTEAAPAIEGLSFLRFLEDRVLSEAETYLRYGLTAMQLENTGAPYAVGERVGAVETSVMDYLAGIVRERYPRAAVGLQILAAGGSQALDIALRRRLDYIRVEGVLFQGIRPEGTLPNSGSLHALYAARRKEHLRREGRDGSRPLIFVDLLKKHTSFPPEIQSLDLWLEQIVFMKLEGVIITGAGTGLPADEASLSAAARAVGKVRENFGIFVPLLAGSGADPDNIAVYGRHAHGVIAGSYIKKDGYWENPLDEKRLGHLAEAASRAGFALQ